jgi:Nuclease-related domain
VAGRRHDDGRVCLCDRPDGTCAGLAVRRLSRDRVRDLAEEIWTASSGLLPTVRPVGDPRTSRAGASSQAAYRRRREQERAAWRPGWAWRWWAVAGAALAVGLLIGLTVGAWLGWPMAVVAAVLAWSRLRFRPSPGASIWKRQAAMQRRTAAVLRPLGGEGYLVLHDVTLPGWLDSVDHLVVGPTGVWVVESWRRPGLRPRPVPPATVRGLRGQAEAVAEVLTGWASVPVRALLCVHHRWAIPSRPSAALRVVSVGRLPEVVRDGATSQPTDLERATSRLLQVLRPAA